MNDLWIKLKFWTKTALISIVVIYVLLFVYKNSGESVKFWWFPTKDSVQTSVFYLSASAFVAGVIVTVLVRTTFKTIKQFRLLKAAKAQRELAEMQTKAAKLQTVTKPATPAEPPVSN